MRNVTQDEIVTLDDFAREQGCNRKTACMIMRKVPHAWHIHVPHIQPDGTKKSRPEPRCMRSDLINFRRSSANPYRIVQPSRLPGNKSKVVKIPGEPKSGDELFKQVMEIRRKAGMS